MRQEDFESTKLLEDAIFKRVKNSDGESINWLKICWMRFVRNEPYKSFVHFFGIGSVSSYFL